MDYEEAWSYLDRLQFFKIKLGLESMAAFLDGVGNPHNELKFIHVAGTNGKGSVSANLLRVLADAGHRVGLYTSPHLSSVRERFRINDRYISRDDFASISTQIRESLEGRQITYFEFTTALALLWFAKEKVDLAILEVGLGGRLDATNVVTPMVGVITNVSMDHEQHLGTTLREIAHEKAGIIKPKIPLVSGVAADVSREVVVESCRRNKAPLFLLGRDFFVEQEASGNYRFIGPGMLRLADFQPAMRGAYQLDNAALALAVIDIVAELGYPCEVQGLAHSLSRVSWPGRLESFCLERHGKKIKYLLDGAHNPAGVDCLAKSLRHDFAYGRLICVWASMGDKDVRTTLSMIAPLCHTLILTRPESERSATTERLLSVLDDQQRQHAICREEVAQALQEAERLASENDLICVAGSLYLIGAARKLLLGELVAE